MDLDTITKMWEKDSQLDDVLLDKSSLKIPQLHQKYLTLHNEFTLLKKKKEQQLKQLHHEKYLYYSGKSDPEVYQENPFHHKILKSDIPKWIEVDEEILKVDAQLDYYGIVIFTLDDILRQVHQMSYSIANAIKWRMFVGGV